MDLVAAVNGRKPFTLSRWADPEWHALFGEAGSVPKDGYFYFEELKQELWKVLASRPGYKMAVGTPDPRAWNTVAASGLDGLDWVDDPVAGLAAQPYKVRELARAASGRLVLVAPTRLRHLKRVIKYAGFVDVPPKNAYLCRDHLVREVLATVEDTGGRALVAVSAGVVGPLLLDDLHKIIGAQHQLADVGGVWDELEGDFR